MYPCCCKCIFNCIFFPFVIVASQKFYFGNFHFFLETGTLIQTVLVNINYCCCRVPILPPTSCNLVLFRNINIYIYIYGYKQCCNFLFFDHLNFMITLNSGLAEQSDWGIEDNILFDEMQFFSCLRFHGVVCFILVYILDDNSNKILFFFFFGKGDFKMRGFVRKYKYRKGLSLNRRGISSITSTC